MNLKAKFCPVCKTTSINVYSKENYSNNQKIFFKLPSKCQDCYIITCESCHKTHDHTLYCKDCNQYNRKRLNSQCECQTCLGCKKLKMFCSCCRRCGNRNCTCNSCSDCGYINCQCDW